jgi:Tfp pilus assembly protein PilO
VSRIKQDPKLAAAAGAGVVLLLVAAMWFVLVSPKRSEATALEQDVAAKQVELSQKQAELRSPQAAVKVRASDLYRVTKALPDANDMSAIILDVNRLAASNKLLFRSLTPQPSILGTGSLQLPMTVVVQGRFRDVSSFLGDVRKLVRVRGGILDARGRAYSVSTVELGSPDEASFPVVKATVTVNAHAYSPPPPVDPSTATTPTTTPSSDGTVAAGATP